MIRRPGFLMLSSLVSLTLLVVGCGSSNSSTSNGANSSTTGGAASSSASSYATVAELAGALEKKSMTCKLEYAGLKDDVSKFETSICTLEGEQAYLRVWQDRSKLQAFLASPDGQTGTVAVGDNWTITVVTPATASKVAGAIGGTAPGGSGSAGTTKP